MKCIADLVSFLALAGIQLCTANTIHFRRSTIDIRAEECNSVECIVNLAELPLQITTCAETVNDFNEAFSDEGVDPLKLATQSADCIAEATLAGVELPKNCGGCFKALDGECPDADVPCTGPPPASGELRK